MNASEMAFKFQGRCLVSWLDIRDWTQFSPADWVCLLYEVNSLECKQEIKEALCQLYAPVLKDASSIIFHYGPNTKMKGAVCTSMDVSEAQGSGWLYGDPSWTHAKRFVAPRGSETYAGVFATYDSNGKVVALAVFIGDKS